MSAKNEIQLLRSLVDSFERNLKEKEKNTSRLNYLATHDALTGLYNRYAFNDEIKKYFAGDCGESKECLVLYMVDLTRFKEINDTLGHAKGDLLLKFIARTLEEQVSKLAKVFRLGGDEFALLLRADPEDVQHCEKETLDTLVAVFTRKYRLDLDRVVVGAAIGICAAPRDSQSADELLKRADIAMYRAKKSNNHTAYRYFDRTLEQELQAKKEFENHILGMIESGKFSVHFQPKIATASEKLVGFEALIRYKDSSGNQLSSLEIIKVAEECNLIWALGDLIIMKSFEFISQMKKKFGDCLPVSINISSLQITRVEFKEKFENFIRQYEIDYSDVGIEITETTLIDKPAVVKNTLLELHDKGVNISIDDFGTGYSSLSYLHNYPFNELKIDQCFIEQIDSVEMKRNIVNGVIQLAHAIGLSVVAEGVESESELRVLRSMDCDVIQGHYYHPAVSADCALALYEKELGASDIKETA